MAKSVNPFRPGSPVVPGMFVGRLRELEQLEEALRQTRAGQPAHFMVTGERGIGKTSLLNYFRYIAKGDIDVEGEKFRLLVIDIDVDSTTTQLTFVRRIELALERELGNSEKVRSFCKDAWSFLRRLEIGDSRLRDEQKADAVDVLADEFAYSLATVAKRICSDQTESGFLSSKYDGVVILIDEADNSSKDLGLGAFLKLLLERLQRHSCEHVLVGLAGLPEVRDVLRESHPSALRIFHECPLGRLSPQEVGQVVNSCLAQGGSEKGTPTAIDQDGLKLLQALSEGYPHFIQQFGYSAYAVDEDSVIDREDVFKGAFGPRGALEIIGDRYYRDDFYRKIQEDSYRQVLRIMADSLDDWISKQEIRKRFRGKDTTLNNAIKALRDRHIILSKEGVSGVYRLQHKGFALWIKFYGSDGKSLDDEQIASNGDGDSS